MSNSSEVFVYLIIIAIVSLVFTYVLFEKLKSYAEAKNHKILGSASFTYGGALAGFIIIFSVLIAGLASISKYITPDEYVEVNLAGEWYMEMRLGNGEIRYGKCNVIQGSGNKYISMVGEVRSVTSPPSISFNTEEGIIIEDANEVIFIYLNDQKETGMAVGTYEQAIEPQRFSVRYFDIRITDENMDVTGKIRFSKTAYPEQLTLKNIGKQEWWLGNKPNPVKSFKAISESNKAKIADLWGRVKEAKKAIDRSISEKLDSQIQFRTKWDKYENAENDYRHVIKGYERFFKPLK
jgi:hypothetical protein